MLINFFCLIGVGLAFKLGTAPFWHEYILKYGALMGFSLNRRGHVTLAP